MAPGKRGALDFAIFVIFFIFRTSQAENARNAVADDVAQPAVNFSSGHGQSSMSLMKDHSMYDYPDYGDHVITGVLHPISGAVPIPVDSQRRHRENPKGDSHLSPSNSAGNVSSSVMAAPSFEQMHQGKHQSKSNKNHVRTGVIHPISGAVPVPVSSQRRHKNPHRRNKHNGGTPSRPTNGSRAMTGSRNNSSARKDNQKRQRHKHNGGNPSRSSNDKHNGAHHQSSPNRARNSSSARKGKQNGGSSPRSTNSTGAMMGSRNTSSARKENHVRTISGAFPVPVDNQRQHRNKHNNGSLSRSPNSPRDMMVPKTAHNKQKGGRHQSSLKRARNTSRKRKGARNPSNARKDKHRDENISRSRKNKHHHGRHPSSPKRESTTASAVKGKGTAE